MVPCEFILKTYALHCVTWRERSNMASNSHLGFADHSQELKMGFHLIAFNWGLRWQSKIFPRWLHFTFREKVLRIIPRNDEEVKFLSSLQDDQDFDVSETFFCHFWKLKHLGGVALLSDRLMVLARQHICQPIHPKTITKQYFAW